jgi:hypothetical protein
MMEYWAERVRTGILECWKNGRMGINGFLAEKYI